MAWVGVGVKYQAWGEDAVPLKTQAGADKARETQEQYLATKLLVLN